MFYGHPGYGSCGGYGYAAPVGGFGAGFALIVVLFILLIIVGGDLLLLKKYSFIPPGDGIELKTEPISYGVGSFPFFKKLE